MATPTIKTTDQALQTTLSLLQDILGSSPQPNFAVRLWDGTVWRPEPAVGEAARVTIVLQHPGALRKMLLPPNELTLGEAYIYNDFDIEGDIEAVFSIGDPLLDGRWGKVEQLRYGKRLLSLPNTGQPRTSDSAAKMHGVRHSKERDRLAVTYHYNRSNDFYKLWLDGRMVYSCAYFATPGDDLDMAQERKLEYLCRKLRLHPGERLLDIGCGWGGLVLYAAQHYGVDAYGITLSEPQAELAQQRIQQAGLTERCRVEVRDYRDVNQPNSFDKIVSVGMFEHVGEALLPTYFKQAWQVLRPGGVFLNHGIASNSSIPTPWKSSFALHYVFPDGELVPINATLRAAESSGFEVRDVENLREHYTLTLRHWVRRLEEHADEARNLTSEVAYRIWRLYMSGAAHGFQTGRNNLYQTLLAKPDRGESGLPLTRADWYRV
ncbi:MAG TPA: cyclopropane-fatty-acyl-phospholipid synthase family protein [Ktedonobacteraceae bacterium]|nr:cyclopropane-fatty-acyl-phospholipid synthase family protein [Ktedonobacteraceae bacterium]